MSNDLKTNIHEVNVKEKRRKYIKTSLHPSKNMDTPLKKNSYTTPPPISMTTLMSKLLPIFITSDKGVNTSSRHLIITGRASTIVLITIIIKVTIIVLVHRNLWRRRGRLDEATKVSLSLSNTVDTGVHLTQLITKASMC